MSTTQQDESPSLALHVLLRGRTEKTETDAEKQAQKHAQDSIRAWWTALSPSELSMEERYKQLADFARMGRGDRAELRRCASPYEAANYLAVHLLAKRLHGAGYSTDQLLDLALVAGVLAEVRTDISSQSFIKSLGSAPAGSDKPQMSLLRFQRLQTCDSLEDFFQQARRAVKLIKQQVDVVDLAAELLAWANEFQHGPAALPKDRLKLRWATAYYCHAELLPAAASAD